VRGAVWEAAVDFAGLRVAGIGLGVEDGARVGDGVAEGRGGSVRVGVGVAVFRAMAAGVLPVPTGTGVVGRGLSVANRACSCVATIPTAPRLSTMRSEPRKQTPEMHRYACR
jgi:hypothetical protein